MKDSCKFSADLVFDLEGQIFVYFSEEWPQKAA